MEEVILSLFGDIENLMESLKTRRETNKVQGHRISDQFVKINFISIY